MPFFTLQCPSCGHTIKKLTTINEVSKYETDCPECKEGTLLAQLGAPAALGKETSDEYRGKSVDQDIKDKLRVRSKEHFRKNQLPRMIDKHGKEYAQQQGFIDAEGNPIDKR